MHTSSRHRRARSWVLLPVAVAAVMLAAACAPEPAPTDPNTPWLAPGCYSSDLEGAGDFSFNGRANVKDNATAYLLDGEVVEDGTCEGDATEAYTVVRAATQAAAIGECATVGVPVHDPPRLSDFGYNVPVDAWACINASEAPEVVEFDSAANVEVTIFGGTEEEPTETTVSFTGHANGTWNQDDGAFAMGLEVDDGSFPANTPLGPLEIFYTATQDGAASGTFDPATGEGSFSMGVTMTLVGLNGPEGMPQPCDIGTAFEFVGVIDLATGELTASQDEFEMTPPAAEDCGGLGVVIADMLAGDTTNTATFTTQVLEPAAG